MIDRLQVRINLCRLLQTEYVALLGQKGTEASTLIHILVSQKPPIPGMKFIPVALPRGMHNSDEFIELFIERLIEVVNQVPPENTLADVLKTVVEQFANRSMDFQLRKVLSTLGKKTTATHLVIVLQALAEAPETPLRKLLLMLRDYHNQRHDAGTAGAKLRFLVARDARLWHLCCHKTADISPFNIAHRFFLDELSFTELQAINTIESYEAVQEIHGLTNGVLSLVEHAINRIGETGDLSSFFSLLQDNWNYLPLNSQEVLKRLIENAEAFPSCFPDHGCPQIPEVDSPWMEAFWAGFLRLEDSKLAWRSVIHKEFANAQISVQRTVPIESIPPANSMQPDNQPDPKQLQSILSELQVSGNLTVGEITQIINTGAASQPIDPNQSLPPKRRILVLAASPVNEVRLRLNKEVREIDLALRLANWREKYVLEQRWAVRADDLRRALLDLEPEIVHFCGHEAGIDGLALEDNAGRSQRVPTDALARLFGLFTNQVQCVVFNACYSEVQAEAICQHIDYVIGMSEAISDAAAIKFAMGFYDALVRGWSYEKAYEFGCNAIELDNLPQHLTPVFKKKDQLKPGISGEAVVQKVHLPLKADVHDNSSNLTRKEMGKNNLLQFPESKPLQSSQLTMREELLDLKQGVIDILQLSDLRQVINCQLNPPSSLFNDIDIPSKKIMDIQIRIKKIKPTEQVRLIDINRAYGLVHEVNEWLNKCSQSVGFLKKAWLDNSKYEKNLEKVRQSIEQIDYKGQQLKDHLNQMLCNFPEKNNKAINIKQFDINNKPD